MIILKKRSLYEFFTLQRSIFVLILFLLIFPKGGIKIGGLPITWGYLSLALFGSLSLFQKYFQVQSLRLLSLAFLIPFQFVAAITLLNNGVESLGFSVSLFLSFVFIPLLFFFLFSHQIEVLDLKYFCSLVKKGVFWVCFYGIVLFFIKLFTGKLIEIPFLTINYHDMGEIEDKCNNRGFVFKLISTYNNGNIFGISLLIILSFYSYLEEARWKRWLVKGSLLLTFSRTVWIGMIFNELLSEYLVNKNKKLFFLKMVAIPLFLVGILVSIAFLAGFKAQFFLDANLGGRIDQLATIRSFSLFSDLPFAGILEIVYLGILEQFGLIGLLCYLMAIGGPIFIVSLYFKRISPIRGSLLTGLITYLFICGSDGALLFIPILVFYWFCASLAMRKELSLPS